MPRSLRRLFATILVFCEPIRVRELWDEFNTYMIEDYKNANKNDHSLDESFFLNCCLKDLTNYLSQHQKNITDYDLPQPTSESITNINKFIVEEKSIKISKEDLDSIRKLNSQQQNAFDSVVHSIDSHAHTIFFIDGPGGTGKTFLYKSILAYIRSKGLIALATATSGIAAMSLPGGRTAHSRFKIPILLDSTSTCFISKQSDLADLIRHASLIIWDEATMAHRHALEALDRTLRDITDIDDFFGGKNIVLGGDFRQVLPVVPNGTRSETIDASLIRAPFWKNVIKIKLMNNMRAINDCLFADFLLRIGNGEENSIKEDMIRVPDEINIPWRGDQTIHDLIDFTFSSLHESSNNKEYIINRAILTPTNESN
ncbi:hypothetical protein Syun_004114 [Stephania yunnanensis]|uniref:ATP-dependent DNA helicase n=1 Tax=Stephania yunnanensis TaxID=152371 RepID=A0AAP0L2E9_9MAGN